MQPLKRIYLLLIFSLGFFVVSNAQTSWQVKETIVLINGVPNKVILHHSGTILEIVEEIKYFSFASKENPDKILSGYPITKKENQPIGIIEPESQEKNDSFPFQSLTLQF